MLYSVVPAETVLRAGEVSGTRPEPGKPIGAPSCCDLAPSRYLSPDFPFNPPVLCTRK